MFDIGFFEILVVIIVALLVIGPEELPNTVRKVGIWLATLRRSYSNIKDEVKREFDLSSPKNNDEEDEPEKSQKKFEPTLGARTKHDSENEI